MIADAWVKLYDDKSFKDRCLTVKGATDIANMDDVSSDDGKNGFGDKASSVRYMIPVGWKAILFDDANFRDSEYVLNGTGKVEEIPDLGSFGDKTSSLRWEETH
jgi:hypothetical protein